MMAFGILIFIAIVCFIAMALISYRLGFMRGQDDIMRKLEQERRVMR